MIDRNVFNVVLAPDAQLAVDTVKAHYEAQGKKNAADTYTKLLAQWLKWGQHKGWSMATMPPDSVELFLAEKGAAFTTTAIMRNSLKALLNVAPSLNIEFPPQVLSAEKYKKKGHVRLADGTRVEVPPDQELPTMNSAPSVSPDVVDITETPVQAAPAAPTSPAPVYAQPAPPPPPQAPPALQSVQNALMGHPTRVLNPSAKPQKAPAPQLTSEEKAAKALLSSAPFFRISRVSDGSDPRIPPGMTTFVGVFPSKDLILHGDIPDFLQRHVVPKTQIRPGTGEILFVVEELDSHRKPTGRREEFPIAVPFGGGLMPMSSQSLFGAGFEPLAPAAPSAPAEPSRTEDMYLKRLEEKIASADAREAELQKKLQESTNMATTMMLMQQMQREQDLRRELEAAKTKAAMPPPADPFGMNVLGGMAPTPSPFAAPPPPPPPPPQDDSMRDLIRILAEKALTPPPPPPPPPPQRDPMEMMMAMMAMFEKLRPSGPPPEVVALTTKMEAMAAKVDEKLSANGTKTLKDQLADLVAMRQAMEVLGGGGNEPSTLEMLAQNADGILKGVAEVIAAGKGGAPQPQAIPVPLPRPRALPSQSVPVPRPQAAAPAPAPRPAPAAQAAQEKREPPAAAIVNLEIMEKAAADADQEVVSAFVNVLQALLQADEPFSTTLKRLINAFTQAEVEQDIYAITKTMFFGLGKKVPHGVVLKVSKILHKHYTAIHAALFNGEERRLEDAVDEGGESQVAPTATTANGATDAAEDEDEDDDASDDEDDDESESSDDGVKLVS